jgi:hypothetical protein
VCLGDYERGKLLLYDTPGNCNSHPFLAIAVVEQQNVGWEMNFLDTSLTKRLGIIVPQIKE